MGYGAHQSQAKLVPSNSSAYCQGMVLDILVRALDSGGEAA